MYFSLKKPLSIQIFSKLFFYYYICFMFFLTSRQIHIFLVITVGNFVDILI